MGKSNRKPRKRIDARHNETEKKEGRREQDWSFEDIARSKTRRR